VQLTATTMAEFFFPVCTVPFEIKQESHFCGLQEFLSAIPSHQKMVIFPEASSLKHGK